MTSGVYFYKGRTYTANGRDVVDTYLIKIGFTHMYPFTTMLAAVKSPTGAGCLGFIPSECAFDLYMQIKKQFKSANVRDDWFKPTEELLEYIKIVC